MSLRLLYLIMIRVFGWLVLLGRRAARLSAGHAGHAANVAPSADDVQVDVPEPARSAADQPGRYKEGDTVERCLAKLKQFRAVATRYESPTRRRATRTRSPIPWQPRWDGAGRCGSLPRPRVRTRPGRRPSRAERRRTGRPGYAECTSQASSPGARVTGQNGRGSAKQAVPRTTCFARTLSSICP